MRGLRVSSYVITCFDVFPDSFDAGHSCNLKQVRRRNKKMCRLIQKVTDALIAHQHIRYIQVYPQSMRLSLPC